MFQDVLLGTLKPSARVFLVANNPDLTETDLHTLGIDQHDLIVQFNNCIHYNHLKGKKGKKAYCFMANHLNSAFGFEADGKPSPVTKNVLETLNEGDFIVFIERCSDLIKSVFKEYYPFVNLNLLISGRIPGFEYPSLRNPSAGYVLFMAVLAACAEMELQNRKPPYIYLVGFSGRVYNTSEVVYHDFVFEKEMIMRSRVFLHRSFGR